jgi:hypothetical protein
MTSVQQTLVKFEAVYDGTNKATALPALAQATEALAELLGHIEAQALKQEARSGASLEKAAALQALGDAAYEVANAVRACAVATGNPELAGQVAFKRAELSRGADKTILNRAQGVYEAASAVLESLADYGVTPAKLTALQRKIEAFREAHPAPRQRVNMSSAATKEVKKLFKEAAVLLKERLDRLMVQYKTSAPEFFNEYTSARVVVDPASSPAEPAPASATTQPASVTIPTPLAKAA